jgi:putative transposase
LIQLKAFKYRIYPNKEQEIFLGKTFGCVRFIWNNLVSNFNKDKDFIGPKMTENESTLKDYHDWLKEVPAVALQQKTKDFIEDKNQYFKSTKGKRAGKKLGRPNFKKRGNNESFRISGAASYEFTSFSDIESGYIKLPKMAPMKIVAHQKFTGKVKNITVSKTPSNQYFVSILVEEDIGLKGMTHREVGIDLGLSDLIITSNGHKFQRVSKQLEKTNRLLKKAQKKLAKKTKGSNNYTVQRVKVAKLYAKVTQIRTNYYHNISSWLVSNYDAIYLENLNVNGMLKNRCLSRAISEASWSTLVGMIKYKSNWYGKNVHQIDRFFPSSKTCSCCGTKIDKLPLSMREWTCESCGTQHDRDLNAAQNIKNQGQLDCYNKTLDTTSKEAIWPMGLMKFVTKTEKSRTKVLVDKWIDQAYAVVIQTNTKKGLEAMLEFTLEKRC